jgi:serine/threonine protein kinase
MTDSSEVIDRLVEAVTDGEEIDWELEMKSHAELEGTLQSLRAIDSIARVFRGATSDDLPPATMPAWGPLELRERIGQGAFGEVYRAWDPALQREVALKLLRSERSESYADTTRFIEEARKLARVRHPNVLLIHGADRHEQRVGLWTELLEGKTLEEGLRENGPFAAQETAAIGLDLCHALAAVHNAGLVHRDVKPANVIRERGGRIVLLDFSVAALRTGETSAHERLSLSGTPLCMAPELFRGEEASQASDVYSLGVLLYRLASEKFPVEARTIEELRERHERGESVPLLDVRPDLPAAFVQVVDRALRPSPEERYASVGEMERALAAFLGRPVEPAPAPAPPAWRRRALPLVAAAAAVVLVVAGSIALRERLFGALEVEASLYRETDGSDERLLPGSQVAPGDKLFLEVEGNRPLHVYVLNEDEDGNAFVLFPLPGSNKKNPLAAGNRHRLPGVVDGEERSWEVTSRGGQESFMVLAAGKRLAELEVEIADMPRASSGGPAVIDQDTIQVLRGIGGLAPFSGDGRRTTHERLSEMFADTAGPVTGDGGVWMWRIRLNNPHGTGDPP